MTMVEGLRRLDAYSLELFGEGAEILINPFIAERRYRGATAFGRRSRSGGGWMPGTH